MGGTSEDAMDIFQDGLMVLIEKLDNKEFTLTCKFKTFLYCVCENLMKTVLTKRKVAENYLTGSFDMEESDISEEMDNNLYETVFHEVFDTLDPAARNILRLYWEELSPQDIAERLGYSYGYVRKKKSEAQAELILKVKNHPEYKRLTSRGSPLKKDARSSPDIFPSKNVIGNR